MHKANSACVHTLRCQSSLSTLLKVGELTNLQHFWNWDACFSCFRPWEYNSHCCLFLNCNIKLQHLGGFAYTCSWQSLCGSWVWFYCVLWLIHPISHSKLSPVLNKLPAQWCSSSRKETRAVSRGGKVDWLDCTKNILLKIFTFLYIYTSLEAKPLNTNEHSTDIFGHSLSSKAKRLGYLQVSHTGTMWRS